MNGDQEKEGTSATRHRANDRAAQRTAEQESLDKRMACIKHKIMVLSGKGGVGKSTVAANLAHALSLKGKRVGLLDVDVHGPSIPAMLGIQDRFVSGTGNELAPVEVGPNLRVMSMGFFLRGRDDALIWRGPLKASLIRQFLSDVEWGDLDYLIIDSPPGTGDEPLSVGQMVPDADGAIIVTTPQEIALADVRRSISFCHKLGLPVLGVVENMSGFVCPHCGGRVDIFKTGGGERMAREMKARFLGRIPLDPSVVELGDRGSLVTEDAGNGVIAGSFVRLAETVMGLQRDPKTLAGEQPETAEVEAIRIAIPVAAGRLAPHFGHSEEFAIIDVDPERREIVKQERLTPPEHQPGALPRWLHEQGATTIICGGMGQRAQAMFQEQGISVITGGSTEVPESIVRAYLEGTLETGENICDH